jgi:hypothetical protein
MRTTDPRLGRYHTLAATVVRCTRTLVFGAGLAGLVHCGEPAAGRYAEHVEATAIRLGPDQRFRAAIAPGRALRADAEATPLEVALHASAPWPSVTLENGTLEPQPIDVTVANVAPESPIRAFQAPLTAEARRDLRCTQPPFSDASTVVVAPPLPVVDPATPTTQQLRVTLSPCSATVLRWDGVEPQPQEERWVVVPRAAGDSAALEAAVQAAEAAGADVIVLLGGVLRRGGGLIEPDANRPVVAVLARRDARTDADRFLRRFGQVDWSIERDGVRWLVLDTADGLLSDGQLRFVEEITSGAMTGVAFMDRIPFGNAGVSAFRSAQQGLRVARLLEGRGIRHVVGNADAGPRRQDWSTLQIHGLRPLSAERTLLEVVHREDASGDATLTVTTLAF